MFNPFNCPGLRYTGDISCENINDGTPLPVFEPVVQEGHPDINTLDGWNALCDRANRRSFIRIHGREPRDTAELRTWEEQFFAK